MSLFKVLQGLSVSLGMKSKVLTMVYKSRTPTQIPPDLNSCPSLLLTHLNHAGVLTAPQYASPLPPQSPCICCSYCLEHLQSLLALLENPSPITWCTHQCFILLLKLITTQHLFVCLLSPPTRIHAARDNGFYLFCTALCA